jgi:hypothetical protein
VLCFLGRDPFIYRDFRGTWRVLCHGGTEKAGWSKEFPSAKIETIGMAFSTDLYHWTAGPGPAATSLMVYANGTHRACAGRFHCGRSGPFWQRFTYVNPVLVKKYLGWKRLVTGLRGASARACSWMTRVSRW